MIGQATASLETPARRGLIRFWGLPDIHARQKWMAMWPEMRGLPSSGVRLLDAGCGTGRWALELAARRPGWSVTGLDREAASIREAEKLRKRLGAGNASFVEADFMNYEPELGYDVVLSVASAHYLVAAGAGEELFRKFGSWLNPGGRLLLLVPRRRQEASFVPWLPRPEWQDALSFDDLARLCRSGRLTVEVLRPSIGRAGAVAKQLDWALKGPLRSVAQALGLYAFEVGLTHLDAAQDHGSSDPSVMVLLIGRRE